MRTLCTKRSSYSGGVEIVPIREAVRDLIHNGDDRWEPTHIEDKISRLTDFVSRLVESLAEKGLLADKQLENMFPYGTEFVWKDDE